MVSVVRSSRSRAENRRTRARGALGRNRADQPDPGNALVRGRLVIGCRFDVVLADVHDRPTKRVHDTKPLVEALELRNLGPGDSSRNETLRLEGDQGNTSR